MHMRGFLNFGQSSHQAAIQLSQQFAFAIGHSNRHRCHGRLSIFSKIPWASQFAIEGFEKPVLSDEILPACPL